MLVTTASHPDIATNTHPATLLRDDPAEGGACAQSRKLLRAVDRKFYRVHLQTEVQKRCRCRWVRCSRVGRWPHGRHRSILVDVLRILDLLVQMEVQLIVAFVPHGQIGEDEITSRLGTVQIRDCCDRDTSQDRNRLSTSRLRDGTRVLQTGVEDEIGIVRKRDVCSVRVIVGVRFKDTKSNDWWGIDWATVGGRCDHIHQFIFIHLNSATGAYILHPHHTLLHAEAAAS